MTVLKAITITALTGLTALGFASASLASATAVEEGSVKAHELLVEEIRAQGVTIEVNPVDCAKGMGGFYSGKGRRIALCQTNGFPGGPMADWTPYDLDTLRHEAQHFIQDCRVGGNHDHSLIPVYRSPTRLAYATLGPEIVKKITDKYTSLGSEDLTILLEYEAFAVAAKNVPLDQVRDMKALCGKNQ